FDDSDGTVADHLTIPEIAQALSAITPLDLLAFDACRMAMAEVEYALRSDASVIVGSQDIEGGAGFDYETALSALYSNPGRADAATLAAEIVQSYRSQAQATLGDADTQSAVSTAAVGGLASALRSFTSAAL